MNVLLSGKTFAYSNLATIKANEELDKKSLSWSVIKII